MGINRFRGFLYLLERILGDVLTVHHPVSWQSGSRKPKATSLR